MLELRPTGEHCLRALPPESIEVRIGSLECPFCAPCVESISGNVGLNGGRFYGPACPSGEALEGGNFPGENPATQNVRHRRVDPAVHRQFSATLRTIPPEQR